MAAYYNEIDLYAAEWLRNLIKAGHIADGEVDTRSIVDVQPEEIKHFDQCHFFAGIAGWSHALRLAGWKDDRKIWTGSCPCQPFSVAGKGKGINDERHLWPHLFRLIRGCRPPVVMGEQVAGAAGYGWIDGVRLDLEGEDYTIEGVDIAACSVNAPHIRQRLYWVANTNSGRCESTRERRSLDTIHARQLHDRMPIAERDTCGNNLANAESLRRGGWKDNEDGWWRQLASPDSCARSDMANGTSERLEGATGTSLQGQCDGSSGNSYWDNAIWLNGADGKTRRAEPNIRLLAHGVPARVGKLRAYGNAIVPPLAAEVVKAFMEELT
ncbi:5 cytosine DNA methyltransferase [Caudoviricetes sp.]|nr:5 cytosine DNA methyltransferase [Caudoviricetes sp.]